MKEGEVQVIFSYRWLCHG